MNGYLRAASIFANVIFVAFLGCLIYNATRTMRVVHELNPLWFVLAAIAIVVLVAVVTEWRSWRSKHGKSRLAGAESKAGGSGPAESAAGQADGMQPSPAQTVPNPTG